MVSPILHVHHSKQICDDVLSRPFLALSSGLPTVQLLMAWSTQIWALSEWSKTEQWEGPGTRLVLSYDFTLWLCWSHNSTLYKTKVCTSVPPVYRNVTPQHTLNTPHLFPPTLEYWRPCSETHADGHRGGTTVDTAAQWEREGIAC